MKRILFATLLLIGNSPSAHAWYGWFDFCMDWGFGIDCPGCPGQKIYSITKPSGGSSINNHAQTESAIKPHILVFGNGTCPKPGACISEASSISQMTPTEKIRVEKYLTSVGYSGKLESAKSVNLIPKK